MATVKINGTINRKLTRCQKSFNSIASKYMKFELKDSFSNSYIW